MAEQVETACDRLVELIQEKGRMSLRDTARALNVSEPVIEEIANVLAEQGIVKVRYTLTGTFIEAVKVGRGEVEKGIAEAKKLVSARKMMEEVGEEVAASERSYRNVEDEAIRRMRKAEELLSGIEEEGRGATEEERAYLLKEAKRLEEVMGHFSSDVKDIREEVAKLTEKIYGFEARTRKAERKPGLLGRLFGKFRGKKG